MPGPVHLFTYPIKTPQGQSVSVFMSSWERCSAKSDRENGVLKNISVLNPTDLYMLMQSWISMPVDPGFCDYVRTVVR